MAFNYKKSATFRLGQASKAYRARAGQQLMRINLHPGQELLIKVLAENDGRTMSELAQALGVQPPTVTKMIARLSAQGVVERHVADRDGRLARVFLTEDGKTLVNDVDRTWKRLEREAMAGIDDKDRKKLRKLLRQIERNLSLSSIDDGEDDDVDTSLDEVPKAQLEQA
ncbi:MAG: MarR family transcriptional regulator [Rhodobacteraceae bacterium]|nr:MarR family transcriptional regulator [Paracoccaceae bacterium]